MYKIEIRKLLALVLVLVLSNAIRAQDDPADWSVGRIYIPSESQESFIPNDFWPIELRELNQKLEQHETKVAEQRLDPLVLDRAVYVATLNRDMIVSDNSFWKFAGHQLSTVFRVGKVSFALKDSKGSFAEQRQLSVVQRFDANGTIELETSSVEQPFWFGFQVAPRTEEPRRTFRFEVPRARLGVMLISADLGVVLASSQCVIQPIEGPQPYLSELWPEAIDPRTQPRKNWWLAHIAGLEEFTIEVSENSADRGQAFQHAVSSASIVHQVSPDSISSLAAFQLTNESKGAPILVRLAANQRIRSLTIDGKSASWKAVSIEPTSNVKEESPQHLIQLNSNAVAKASRIEIQTIRKTPEQNGAGEYRLSLPNLELLNSAVISGSTTVGFDDTLEATNIQSAQSFLPVRGTEGDATANRWRASWSKQPPGASLLVRNRGEKWNSSSFIRIDSQANALAAKINMVMSGINLRTNALRLPVLPGWNVERVKLPLDVTGKIRTRLESSDQGDQIVLNWTGKPESFEVYLEVSATRVLGGNSKSILIENPRVLQSPQANSPAFYVISDSAFYRLRNTATLFPMIVPKRELTSWQQQLVREQDTTIFKDLADSSSRFVLDSIPYPTMVRTAVFAKEDSGTAIDLRAIMLVEPGPAGIDHLRLSLPEGQAIENWTIEFRSEGAPATKLVAQKIQSEADSSLVCQVELPQLTTGPFRLIASTKQSHVDSSTNTLLVPIPTALGVSTVESNLILQSKLAPLMATTSLIFQPSTTCCSSEMLEQIDQDLKNSTKDDNSWLSAKLTNTEANYLALTAVPSRSSTLIWRENLRHEITTAGMTRHYYELDVQSAKDDPIQILVPNDWTLIKSQIGASSIEASEEADGELTVRWPFDDRGVLKFEFAQQSNKLGWIQELVVDRPRVVDIPTLSSEETVHIPAGFAAARSKQLYWEANNKASVFPMRLWELLSPASSNNFLGISNSSWKIESESAERSLWLINRSSLSAGLISVIAVLGILAWQLIRRSLRAWWVAFVVTLLIVSTIHTGPLGALQLVLLSLVLGLIARLLELVSQKPRAAIRRSPVSACWLIAVGSLALSGSVWAQSTDVDSNSNGSNKKIYGVIIPFETSPDNPGEYAYISKELRDLLTGVNSIVTAKSSDPKLISASYLMKLRQDPRDATPVQEFEAEFKIVVSDANGQLLLPFDLSLLHPTSLVLNGQPRLLGVRYFEEAEDGGGIIFRPDTTGAVTVNMKFQVSVKDSAERRFAFETSLPPVPNSTLRILPNALTTAVVSNASGGLLRTLSNDYVAHLGPIDKLQVQWSEGDRNTTSFISEYVSETWVRGQPDGFTVACQLTIDRGRSAQEEFDLIVDSDWEPVGSAWGDALLVSSNVVTALKRRVIRIKLSEAAGPTCSFRMMLAQRQTLRASSVDVPFVSVDRMSLKSRVFWWSPDVRSAWMPEGTESLPTRMARDEWGELRLASERTGFQVLGSGIKLRSNSANAPTSLYNENSTLRIFSSHSELEMEATWEKPVFADSDLVLQLPPSATLKKLEANGRAIFGPVGGQDRITVAQTVVGANTSRVKVVVELPPIQGRAETLPRIEIEAFQPRQANYAIIRGSDLSVRFSSTDSGLVFSPVTGRRVNIENLETFVGESNLPSELLGDPYLAAPIEVLPSTTAQHRSLTMNVERFGANFRATVRCVWTASNSPNYAIFEVPTSLREQITAAPLSTLFKPHRDESKTTLCIPVPAAGPNNTRSVEFSFPVISAASSQSLTIPNIVACHNMPDQPVVILPSKLDGRDVSWQSNGLSPQSDWFASSETERLDSLEYLKFGDAIAKLSWQFLDAEKSQSNVSIVIMDLASISRSSATAVVSYGIGTRNLNTQLFDVDSGCEILGVDYGARSANWTREDNQLRVSMQTNSLPTIVRLMVRWNYDSSESPILRAPKPDNASLPSEMHVFMPTNPKWFVSGSVTAELDSDSKSTVNRWAELLVESMNLVSSTGAVQLPSQYDSWNPRAFRLSPEQIITSTSLRKTLLAYDGNEDGEVSVGELWLHASGRDLIDSRSVRADSSQLQSTKQRVDGLEVGVFRRLPANTSGNNSALVAAVVLITGIAGLVIGPKVKSPLLSMLSLQPWIFWGFLAVVVAIALPISWPSWIIAITAIWMAATQLIEYRRKTRRFGF